jgi:xanthine dehydrogenase/oxidase
MDPTQELIFPPALRVSSTAAIPLAIQGPRVQWIKPVTLDQLLSLRKRFPHNTGDHSPQYRIVAGNSEIGVETKIKGAQYEVLVSVSHIPQLCQLQEEVKGIVVGAAVTLNSLLHKLSNIIKKLPECKTRAFSALLEMLRWFAGEQIRNTAVRSKFLMETSDKHSHTDHWRKHMQR